MCRTGYEKYNYDYVKSISEMVNEYLSEYLAMSLIERKSYDEIEKELSLKGECLAVSKSTFYKARREVFKILSSI